MTISLLGINRRGPQIGPIQINCSVEERHRSSNTVTQFPIESGVGISDHIQREQDELMIHGIISDAPINFVEVAANIGNGLIAGSNAVQSTAAKTFGITPLQTQSINPGKVGQNTHDTAQVSFAKLKELVDQGSVFKVITGLAVYENMAFVSLEINRDKKTGRVLNFHATLKSIEFVFSERRPLRSMERTSVPVFKGKQATGAAKNIPTDRASEPAQSPLKRLLNPTKGSFETDRILKAIGL